jgi:hypothetical protein
MLGNGSEESWETWGLLKSSCVVGVGLREAVVKWGRKDSPLKKLELEGKELLHFV